jgi:predicted PurR-regulated permease PerM
LITIYTGFRLFGIVGLILGIILLVIGVSVYNGLKASKDREELLPE